ncbi:MAG: alkaline phosphatase D family protein [Solirubrobacterales bacterium]
MGRGAGHLAGAVVAALAVALAIPASAVASERFPDGVTAAEIKPHSAILWTRVSHAGPVRADVSTSTSRFRRILQRRHLTARAKDANTVEVKIRGLEASRAYRYRFCVPAHHPARCSRGGLFTTAPSPSADIPISFAYSGDETAVAEPGHSNPFWGDMKAFESMAHEPNNFNIDFGDTIYSDPEVPGANTALSVKAKWRMYRKKLSIQNMRQVRAGTGMYDHWDDHEFINDFSIPENGRKLYDRGKRAFRDFEPVDYNKKTGIYRTFRWGKNLELFFLDERSFRSAKASANGACDNPDTHQPDLAPTAPQSKRNFFAALIPSLANPVSRKCKNRINSPNRTFLGDPQFHRFLRDVRRSKARWKVVMNEDPIQQFYGLPYDRWEGYAYERVKLLKALERSNVNHLVFLTTDTHAAFANVVRLRTLTGDVAPSNAPTTAPADTPFQDFVIGPVATRPFWQEIDATTGTPNSGKLLSQLFFKLQPQAGVGMACAQGNQNSYAEVTVTRGTLRVAYKDENGNTVKDVDGTTNCGPYLLH